MTEGETIELRRYPSRKIYNKTTSSYIRLPEVADMIRDGANIRVEDTETGEDVTRQVLLQIIMEQEHASDRGVLSADLMMDMIRMQQGKASEMMTGLFEQSLAFMRAQQEKLATQVSQVSTSLAQPPWAVMNPAQVNEATREFQQRLAGFWGAAGANWPGALDAAVMTRPAASNADVEELKVLRERLEALERKVGGG